MVIVVLLTIAAVAALPAAVDLFGLIDLPGERTVDALAGIVLVGVIIAGVVYLVYRRTSDGD